MLDEEEGDLQEGYKITEDVEEDVGNCYGSGTGCKRK